MLRSNGVVVDLENIQFVTAIPGVLKAMRDRIWECEAEIQRLRGVAGVEPADMGKESRAALRTSKRRGDDDEDEDEREDGDDYDEDNGSSRRKRRN